MASHLENTVDWDHTIREIVTFTKNAVNEARADGVVVGLSGGVDSSLVAALSVRALGKESVLGVMLPMAFTPTKDIQDAKEVARLLGIQTECIPIQPVTDCIVEALKVDSADLRLKIPLANICARTRMVVLYYFANAHNYLVAGTGDRSELLIGYFTKYGDGGADFLPIGHLYKTQVRKLAQRLGIPQSIAFKPSSPQLYPGHKATDEIPIDYEKLDHVERMLFEDELTVEEVSDKTHVNTRIVEDVVERYRASAHKRSHPSMVREL